MAEEPNSQDLSQLEWDEAERALRKMSRRAFLWAAGAMALVYGGIRGLASRPDSAGVGWPFRRALETNESIWHDLFKPGQTAPTFDKAELSDRENGEEGLSEDFDPSTWMLTISNVYGQDGDVKISLADLKKLPHVEMTTEFKCIEGWSAMMHWKGVRFADLAAKYPPPTVSGDPPNVVTGADKLVNYVSMETPDAGYYVGLDMASALHPQTLLAWEMNGAPLTDEHGAPLRLVIPVKYGVKNIKRVGKIAYSDQRPRDFWAEQGYDWFAGL